MLSTGVLAAVLYLLGTRYVSRSTGVLAAAFALGTPLVFVNLTRGYTDLTATTLVGLALLLATLAADAADEAREAGRGWGWRVPALLAACGFVTGWSFEVRETAIFAWPVIGWVLWRIGRPLRTLAWFAPPALAWLALDMLLCARGLRRPVPEVPDHPRRRHLRVRGELGRRLCRAVPVVVHDGPAALDPRGLRGSGPPGLPGRGGGGGRGVPRTAGPDLGLGDADRRAAVDPGRTARPRPSLRAPRCRALLAVVHRPADARGGGHDGDPDPQLTGCPARGGCGRRRACWPSGWSCRPSRFATSYPGFAPNGGDAMVELRAHLASRGGELAGARVWADWGTQRVLPAYQTSPFGDPRWEAGSFRSLNRLVRFPPTSAAEYPQPGEYVVIYSARGPHLLALPAGAAAGSAGVRPAAGTGLGGAVHLLSREPHALPPGPDGGVALRRPGGPPGGQPGRGGHPGGLPVAPAAWCAPSRCAATPRPICSDQGTTATRSSTDRTSGAFVAVLE